MNKTAIVFGATGVVGREVLEYLSKSEHFSLILTFTRTPIQHPSTKVKNHVINFDQLDEIQPLLKGNCLFSCLGSTKKQAGSIANQRIIDIDYPRRIAQLAAQNKIEHFLLVSSFGADRISKSPYLKMKGELEDAVTKLPFKKISIFRPSLLIGKRNDFRLGEQLAKYILPIICLLPGLKKFRPIKGKQVAQKMVSLTESAEVGLQVFNLDEIFIKE